MAHHRPTAMPLGGLALTNHSGELIGWVRGSEGATGTDYILWLSRPEKADSDEKANLENSFERVKALAHRIGVPVFDAQQVVQELNEFVSGLDDRAREAMEFSGKPENLTLDATNLVDGKLCSLTVRVRGFLQEDGKFCSALG